MNIELLNTKDNGRKVIPLTTKSGLQIGSLYQPKPCPNKAECAWKHSPKKGYGKWVLWSIGALIAMSVIAQRGT